MKINLRYREFSKGSCVADGQEYFREVEIPKDMDASELCKILDANAIIEYTGFGDSGHITGKWRSEGPIEPGQTYSVSLGDRRLQRNFLKRFNRLESIE